MTQTLPIVFTVFLVLFGCDNTERVEVPSVEGGRGLAPAKFEVREPAPVPDAGDPPPAAWVDDEPIPAAAVDRELARVRRLYGEHHKPFTETVRAQKRALVVQGLIDELLIDRWIEASEAAVSEREVDAEIARRVDAIYGSRAALDRYLANRGTDAEEHRRDVRREIATRRLLAESPPDSDAGIAQEEVEELYEEVAGRSATVPRLRLSSVLFGRMTSLREVEEQLADIDDERAFRRLAKRVSERESSLGWVERPAIDEKLAAQLSRVEAPGLSDPIKTPAGYQVYWVHERERRPSEHFERVRAGLTDRRATMQLARKREELLRRLREEAEIRYEREATTP